MFGQRDAIQDVACAPALDLHDQGVPAVQGTEFLVRLVVGAPGFQAGGLPGDAIQAGSVITPATVGQVFQSTSLNSGSKSKRRG